MTAAPEHGSQPLRSLAFIGAADEFEIVASSTPHDPPRFRVVAYSGAAVETPGFPHPLAVDPMGVDARRTRVPVVVEASASRRPTLGYGHLVEINAARVVVEGVVKGDDPAVEHLVAMAANGFPFSAAIVAEHGDLRFVPAGETVSVRGRPLEGPAYVAGETLVRGIAIGAAGEDPSRSLAIAAAWRAVAPEPTRERVARFVADLASSDAAGAPDADGIGQRIATLAAHRIEAEYRVRSTATRRSTASVDRPASNWPGANACPQPSESEPSE